MSPIAKVSVIPVRFAHGVARQISLESFYAIMSNATTTQTFDKDKTKQIMGYGTTTHIGHAGFTVDVMAQMKFLLVN